MEGKVHLMIAFAGMLGFMVGHVLIDLDHSGLNPKSLWKCFWSADDCSATRGDMHKPIIGVSIAVFSLMVGLGMLLHLWLDGVIT